MDLEGNNDNFGYSAANSRSQFHSDMGLDGFTSLEGGTSYSSPAIPTVYDLTSASNSASNMGTVSPHDLVLHDPYASAPGSTAFTALTSPSEYNASPEFDSYDVSPAFGAADLEAPDVWYPLFPQAESHAVQPTAASQSPEKEDQLEVVEPTTTSRRKSGHSPPSGRHSSVSGVNSRRRDKPLPPIVVDDPHDTVAMKRARNTLAARKSRERKAQKLEDLEAEIEKLTAERDHWKRRALGQE
jgi:general control protein GCN4